jgi:hypothetical protein
MKPVNTGNAGTGTVLAGNGVHLGDERHEEAGRGSRADDGAIARTGPIPATEHHSIAQLDGNRRAARYVPEQGSDACVNGGSDAHQTRGR